MVSHNTRVELRYTGILNGKPYAVMDGMSLMLWWFAGKWNTSQHQCKYMVLHYSFSCHGMHAYAYACHGACAYYVATMIFPALSYDDHFFKSKRSPLLLTNVGCHGSEHNLTSCCSVAIPSQFHCFNQTYAGVRCMQVDWLTTYGIVRAVHNITWFVSLCRFSVCREQYPGDWWTLSTSRLSRDLSSWKLGENLWFPRYSSGSSYL